MIMNKSFSLNAVFVFFLAFVGVGSESWVALRVVRRFVNFSHGFSGKSGYLI